MLATSPPVSGRVETPRRSLPFAAVPHDLVADRRLKPIDLLVVAVLLRFARSKPSCWPSVATLAADVGRCVRTVQYSLRRLEAAGWIGFRPDPNPTGRAIVLVWLGGVQRPASPPVQKPYSQGLPGVQRPAVELRPKTERDGSAPAVGPKAPEKPLSAAEFSALVDLPLPPGSPLKAIFERKLLGLVGRR